MSSPRKPESALRVQDCEDLGVDSEPQMLDDADSERGAMEMLGTVLFALLGVCMIGTIGACVVALLQQGAQR